MAHRRVQSTQAAPRHPSPDYDPPIYQPHAPDYDFNPQQLAPPPSNPTLTQPRYNQDQDPIHRFQENQLSESDEQWHELVPEETRASLPESEVKRQSAIFEIIKTEKEYVANLEDLRDVSSILSCVHRPLIALGVIDSFSSLRSSTPGCPFSISKSRPSSTIKSFPISTGSLSCTGLSWVQLSRGTQCSEQGDRAGRVVSRQGTKIGWRLPQLNPCYLYIEYGTCV